MLFHLAADNLFDGLSTGALDVEFVALVEEEAVVDDAGDGVQEACEFFDVLVVDGDIDDEVAVVGEEELAVAGTADDAGEAEGTEVFTDGSQAEGDDADGEGGFAAEPIDEFVLADHVDAFVGGVGDDAFARHRAAGTLEHPEFAVHLVGAVKEDVDTLDHGEVGEAKALAAGEGFGGVAGGNTLDLQPLFLHPVGEGEYAARGGTARSQPDNHAGLDLCDNGFGKGVGDSHIRPRFGSRLIQSGSPVQVRTSRRS